MKLVILICMIFVGLIFVVGMDDVVGVFCMR